jgi:hypothetical protein
VGRVAEGAGATVLPPAIIQAGNRYLYSQNAVVSEGGTRGHACIEGTC